jgi:hypothetical protein
MGCFEEEGEAGECGDLNVVNSRTVRARGLECATTREALGRDCLAKFPIFKGGGL